MSIPEAQLNKVHSLVNRIQRVRAVLGDQKSPPHLIERKKGAQKAPFKRRVQALQKLEVQLTRTMEDIIPTEENEDE